MSLTYFGEQSSRGHWYVYQGRELVHERSPFQEIRIFENEAYGRMLVLDGLVQTTDRDEFIYHEMLVHVPLVTHGAPRRVLIIGGGDGGSLRRALEHPTVEQVVMVEIDGRVVDLCKEYLPAISGSAFDDPRAEVVIGDGIAYLRETSGGFDAVILDTSEAVGPGVELFGEDFYQSCRRALAPGGIVAAQLGSPVVRQDEVRPAYEHLTKVFGWVRPYLATIPTYPGTVWAFGLAAVEPRELTSGADAGQALATRYWNPQLHQAAFALPSFVADVFSTEALPLPWGAAPDFNQRTVVPGGEA